MASVAQLGYLGIGISDPKAWQNLATTGKGDVGSKARCWIP
jgi:hypothetical protein